jgi:hypothetical protein
MFYRVTAIGGVLEIWHYSSGVVFWRQIPFGLNFALLHFWIVAPVRLVSSGGSQTFMFDGVDSERPRQYIRWPADGPDCCPRTWPRFAPVSGSIAAGVLRVK